MELASMMLALALFLVVAAFVLRPILRPAEPEHETNPEAHFLQVRRARVLAALADLDFDHSTGKIDRADYESERSQLVADGVEVLKQLDDAGLTSPIIVEYLDTRPEGMDRIHPTDPTPDALEHLCPQCDAATGTNDKFCAKCGYALDPCSEDTCGRPAALSSDC